jgi:hypothetical protein
MEVERGSPSRPRIILVQLESNLSPCPRRRRGARADPRRRRGWPSRRRCGCAAQQRGYRHSCQDSGLLVRTLQQGGLRGAWWCSRRRRTASAGARWFSLGFRRSRTSALPPRSPTGSSSPAPAWARARAQSKRIGRPSIPGWHGRTERLKPRSAVPRRPLSGQHSVGLVFLQLFGLGASACCSLIGTTPANPVLRSIAKLPAKTDG